MKIKYNDDFTTKNKILFFDINLNKIIIFHKIPHCFNI